ncbi:MAG: tetratricopeptide repeat protein [Mediterranea massiliensis]|nr:tetratricopeptide repeat protein [Mediterranea massiliensis]
MEELDTIKRLINQGHITKALTLLEPWIESTHECKDEAYYLRGNAFRKQGNWQQALNNYQQAIDLNPESPATEARRMVIDILDFYNKDMFNQ